MPAHPSLSTAVGMLSFLLISVLGRGPSHGQGPPPVSPSPVERIRPPARVTDSDALADRFHALEESNRELAEQLEQIAPSIRQRSRD